MARIDDAPKRSKMTVFRMIFTALMLYLPFSATVIAASWPQSTSDIPADPSIRFGVLENGMRYAVMRNTTPKRIISIRLRFDAGSIHEADDQQGLAHFLEHMAFRGSKRVPESEVWTGLQRLGMVAGADANASTSFMETIYKLDLPHNDPETIETGLLRMRETASELKLEQSAMDAERGPILSEERLRATASYRSFQARYRLLYPDHIGTRRFPIGQVETLKTAPVTLIRKFYDEYYRPERAVLVAVGDFELEEMEKRIKDKFGDWSAVGKPGSEPVLSSIKDRTSGVSVFSEPGAPSVLTLSWSTPYKPEISRTLQREDLIDKIGFEILNRRLQALPNGPEHPFAGTGIQFSHDFNTANVRTQVFEIKPENWRDALQVAVREARRIAVYGVTQQEIDGVVSDLGASFQAEVNKANTRQSARIASEIVQSIGSGEVVSSREDSLAAFQAITSSLTVADVSKSIREAMEGHGPFVFLSSPAVVEGGVESVTAILRQVEGLPVVNATVKPVETWPYTQFGAPGKVVETRTVDDLGTTFLTFENGVRLTIKTTRFQTDQVLVSARIGAGRLSLPKDKTNMIWAVQRGAFIDGGLKDISFDMMKRALTGKVYGTSATILDDALSLSGETRSGDLPTQLQVLAAYVASPGFRAEGFDSAKTEQENLFAQIESSPSGVFQRDLTSVLASGDKRWAFPKREDVAAARNADLEAFLRPTLASGRIELIIVGDISVQRAIEAVSRTFGGLPKREASINLPDDALVIKFPQADQPVKLTHKGRADQGMAFIAWPTPDLFSDTKRSRELRILERIFQSRITEQLRVQDGATYSPGTALKSSDLFKDYGFLASYAELPAAKMPLFYEVATGIARDLTNKDVSQDELDRAKKPRLTALQTALQTNSFWIETLAGAQTDERRLDLIRTASTEVERVTAADVRRVATRYLNDVGAFRLTVIPEAKTEIVDK